jgi:glucose-1-phosphate thymidylyltransferase
MKAVILAAGEGTRLRPFTLTRPKVMLPVAGRPILQHVVQGLVASGMRDIVIVVGYKKERIMSYFEDGKKFGASIEYVVQEKQLGTAHALSLARPRLGNEFVVLAGDNIIDQKTVSGLLKCGSAPCVLYTESDIPSKYGVMEVAEGRVQRVVEKPQIREGNIINTGIYRLDAKTADMIVAGVGGGQLGITDILRRELARVDLKAVRCEGQWLDAVYPWDLIHLNEMAMNMHGQEIAGVVEEGAVLKGPIQVGKGSRIRSGCYIEGPVIIGEGCDIGPNATIFPSSYIGNGCNIEAYVMIANSILMAGVSIGSHSHICQGVFGEGVRVAPGLMAACGCGHVRVDDEFHKVDHIGSMVGDDAVIGSRVVITAGVIAGAGCRVGDGAVLRSNVPDRGIVV